MNRRLSRLVFGALILLGATLARGAEAPDQNKELDQFFKAKSLVFSGDWSDARSGMEAYLSDYPTGKMRDEALYWLAKSMDRQARDARDVSTAIELKRKAFSSLDRLAKDFPASLWRDDAGELQMTIAGGLAVLGVEAFKKYLEDAVRAGAKNGAGIKAAALESIMELPPQTAIPVLSNFLKTESDAGLRKRAVALLGRKYAREVTAILQETAQNDREAEIRKEAGYWLDKIRIRLIPVQLNYYCYEFRAVGAVAYAHVPEGKVVSFEVPHGRPGSSSRAKDAIERVIEGRIESTRSMSVVSDATEQSGRFGRYVSHMIGGFFIELEAASIIKTAADISGRVRIGEIDTPFKVNGSNDVILAARRGERLAVMYLEMASKDAEVSAEDDEPSASSAETKTRASRREPVYHSVFKMEGISIQSTRSSIDGNFQNSALVDFAQAEAEIPGSDGTWILTGFLLFQNKEKTLVGRMARLVRPDGSTAADGEIRVPVGHPERFKAESGGEPKYATSYSLENGGRIFSSRGQFQINELNGEVIDFGLSQASLPSSRGVWKLTGRFVFLKGEQRIIARDAVLTDPDGKTAAQGKLLIVPAKTPEKFTRESERSN